MELARELEEFAVVIGGDVVSLLRSSRGLCSLSWSMIEFWLKSMGSCCDSMIARAAEARGWWWCNCMD